jgi:hypothetical protein
MAAITLLEVLVTSHFSSLPPGRRVPGFRQLGTSSTRSGSLGSAMQGLCSPVGQPNCVFLLSRL